MYPPIMSLVHFQFGNLIKCAKSLNSYSTWLGIELVSLSRNSRNLLCGILFLDTFTANLNNSTKSNHFPFSFLCAIGIIRGESLNFSIFMAFLASMNFYEFDLRFTLSVKSNLICSKELILSKCPA